jgi:hypothetical protein
MSNAAGTEALACSVAAARLTSATLRLVATRAATRSPDMRAAPTMKRRLGPESIFSAVGDSPWLVDRRGACGGCLCRSGGAHKSSGALAACAERPLYIIECPAFGRIDSLPRPESGRAPCHAKRSQRAAVRHNRSTCSRQNRRRRPACRHALAATSPRYGCATANARAHRVPQHCSTPYALTCRAREKDTAFICLMAADLAADR